MRPIFFFLPLLMLAQSPDDPEAGRKLYLGRCAHCHGQNGEGGRGVALNTGRFRHGGSPEELFRTIRQGIPNTEMPPAPRLPDHEISRMAAWVAQLGRQQAADEKVTGDAEIGAALYKKHACAQCHTLHGVGGFLGPDLTGIGPQRSVRHLRESMVNPGAEIPLDYRTVAITTAKGDRLTGIHLNEDEYSLQMRDPASRLRVFLKSELREVSYPRQSLMPAYALAKAEQDHLIAFLNAETVWRFDRLDSIGGHKTTVLGQPKVIDTPLGKAVEFDGVDDALFIENHPLAGAKTFTWEAIFRPDGGQFEQRWFHLSENGSENRMLYEIRVVGDKWYLDSFNQTGDQGKALMNREALHPLGQWHHVATVYDGKVFRNFVNGVEEGSAEIQFAPQGDGRSSVGVRINKVFYFKGAVHSARFTRRALTPSEFQKLE